MLKFQQIFPGHSVYCGGQAGLPELVEWQQFNQNQSRKDFIPALKQSFEALFSLSEEQMSAP